MAGNNKTTKLPAGEEVLDIRTPNRNLPGTRTRTFSVPAFPFLEQAQHKLSQNVQLAF